MSIDRRSFLQILGASALSIGLPESISRALAIPANNKTGTLADVEHIVFLMQENRAFDHYLGSLNGVRGFNDPRAVKLHGDNSVFYQPVVAGTPSPYVLPYHPTAPNLGLQFIADLEHGWDTTHVAWNVGNWDQWVPAKSPLTMVYLTRPDSPYHYALADAFTVCDAYHASLLGPTDPNRYHMFTAWVGNDGNGGGPVVDNAEAGYSWLTFPEILQDGGITWRVYQDIGTGLNAAGSYGDDSADPLVGNYGDNSLLYFDQYRNAPTSSPLYQRAVTGTNAAVSGTIFDQFRADCAANALPQVSWICAPEACSEHPNWPANYGAYYVSQILDALTANPEVWSKTAFFLTYDENDGFFDHVVPPTPPMTRAQGISTVPTTNEIFAGNSTYEPGPYGIGLRVPMVVISPWSKGGYVSSEVFDHTSLIRFIEKRFGPNNASLKENNITKWRRAVTGDLTSAFNFTSPNDAKVPLPSTVAYLPPDNQRHPDYVPAPPPDQAMPAQEPGTRPARPVPYELSVHGKADLSQQAFRIDFGNTGKSTAVYHVRSGNTKTGPWTYTIQPGAEISDSWTLSANSRGAYDLSVYGPNGFLRSFKGSSSGQNIANLDIETRYDESGLGITLDITNLGESCQVSILDSCSK